MADSYGVDQVEQVESHLYLRTATARHHPRCRLIYPVTQHSILDQPDSLKDFSVGNMPILPGWCGCIIKIGYSLWVALIRSLLTIYG